MALDETNGGSPTFNIFNDQVRENAPLNEEKLSRVDHRRRKTEPDENDSRKAKPRQQNQNKDPQTPTKNPTALTVIP